MALTVTSNLQALNTSRQLKVNSRAVSKTQEKLSSGYAINRASDDAAGLAISEKMRSMIRGLDRGSDNIQDGISLVQVADGALNEVTDMLQRMNELSVQAANGTLSDADRSYIQSEISQLNTEIDRIGKTTKFNDQLIFGAPEELTEHVVYNTSTETKTEIVQLISSPSEGKGYMVEAYQTSDGKYRPAASLDFSNVNENNITSLYGKSFSFTCTESCGETFKFTLVGEGESSAENLRGKVEHRYTINIGDCKTGAEVLSKVYDYVYHNLPTTATTPASYGDDLKVSHSNGMHISGNKLIVYSSSKGYSTESAAKKEYASGSGAYGKAVFSELTGLSSKNVTTTSKTYIDHEKEWEPGEYDFRIQCSGSVPDEEHIRVKSLTARALHTDQINVSTESGATDAIDLVTEALTKVTDQRSLLGASQNRLEHAMAVNKNTEENTQSAESLIRDSDMAEEMVRYSVLNILMQAGNSVLAQANSSSELALGLLG